METFGDKITSKNEQNVQYKYFCNICDYNCYKKFNYNRHLLTSNHIKLTKGDILSSINEQNEQNNRKYYCEKCNKQYLSRNGLWKHKQKCYEPTKKLTELDKDEISDKELIIMVVKQNAELIKDNSELKNMMMKVIENGTHNITNNTTHTNSHNKAFNLQFFLNETCKDAMNIMDFVDSIKLQLSDLERIGEKGFVEGISNIIIQNLKNLDVTKRPVHCTDKKREILYVKDENKWEKEDTDNKKVRKAIKQIANKNTKMLNVFREKYPDCIKSTSLYSDKYNKLVYESYGGSNNQDSDNENKIIKKLSQEVIIEKEQ